MGMVSEMLTRRAAARESRASVGASVHPSRLDDPRVMFGRGFIDNSTGLDLGEGDVIGWPAVLQATRLISWSIGMTPCQLFEKSDGGSKKLKAAEEHPLYWILHDEPHPEYTPFEWKSQIPLNCILRGNSYGQIITNNAHAVERVAPLNTHRMVGMGRINGRLKYTYRPSNGGQRVFDMDEVLHVPGFSPEGLLGMALHQLSPGTVAKGVAMDRFGARVFKDGVSGAAVVETDVMDKPIQWKDDDQKKAFFDKLSDSLTGEKNWHKVIGLPMGMKIRTLGISAKEAQLVEGLTFQVQDVARLTGVPPSLLMDLSRATFSNVEQQMLQFFKLVLGPWFTLLEQRFAKSLLTREERRRYVIKFNPDAILRTTLKERYDAYRIAVGRPWMSPNEARDLEDMPSLGEVGDVVMEPLNMGNPGGDPKLEGGQAPAQDGDSSTRSLGGMVNSELRIEKEEGISHREENGNCGTSGTCGTCGTEEGRTTTEGTEVHGRSEGEGSQHFAKQVQPALVPHGGSPCFGYRNAGRPGFISVERRAELRDLTRERRALRAAFRGQIERDGKRLMAGVSREVRKLLDKAGVGERAGKPILPRKSAESAEIRDGGEFGAGVASYFDGEKGFGAAVERILGPVFETYADAVVDAVARERGVEAPDLSDFVKNYIKSFIQRKGGSLKGQIEKLIKEVDPDELRAAIEKRLDEWEAGREEGGRMSQAEKIGSRESVQIGDAVATAAFKVMGVSTLVWLANSGACPICEELDGQTVGIDEVFVEASGTVDPQDDNIVPLKTRGPVLHAPLHGGCECMVAAA